MPLILSSYLIPANGNSWFLLEDKYVKGGYQVVADTLARDAILSSNRKAGMLVYTQADGKTWRLNADLLTWAEMVAQALSASVTGLATLDATGKIPVSQLPPQATVDTFVVGSEAAMLAVAAQQGDIAVRTDLLKTFVLTNNSPGVLASWQEMLNATTAPVVSVNGMVGAVTIPDYVLPVATATVLGGVKQGTNVTIDAAGVISVPSGAGYALPTASATVLGGVKVGSGLAIASGVLSVSYSYTLPVASTTVLGGVKQGTNVTIDANGVISVATGAGYSYTLPTASGTVLGGVKVGTGLAIDAGGVLSATATAYSLPVATATVLGGVKQGTNVSIAADGTISVPTGAGYSYTLPVATTTVLGGVKQGTNITIAADGTISAASGVALASTAPAAPGTTAAGTVGVGTTAARADHVHPMNVLPYDIVLFASGNMTVASETVSAFVATRKISLAAGLAGSLAKALVAPAAAATLTVFVNGVAKVTASFGAGVATGTLSLGATLNIMAGDIVELRAPATVDSSLSGVMITLVGVAEAPQGTML